MSEKSTCTQVPIDKLVIDARFQRKLEEKRVTRIVQNFDPKLLGTLELSKRANGTYSVIDGQHRFEALKAVGRKRVSALVHENLSVQEEANLFARLNMTRKPLTAIQRFRAQLFSGDPQAVEISEIVTGAGFRLIEGGESIGDIQAIASIERAYRNCGADTLRQALTSISDLWFGEEAATSGNMISGFSLFLQNYGARFDEQHAERLRRVPSLTIVRRAQERTMGGSQSTTAKFVAEELRRVTGLRGTSGRKDQPVLSKTASDELASV